MSDPIISPDGQFMWTGSDWIPVPPKSTQPNTKPKTGPLQEVNLMIWIKDQGFFKA